MYDGAAIEALQPVIQLHRDMLRSATHAQGDELDELIARGHALGVRPRDLLVGLLQPALYELGERWARATLTPGDEARYTRRCEETLTHMEAAQESRNLPRSGRAVLLATGRDNRHSIGLRMAAFALREEGVDVRPCLVGCSAAELVEATREVNPAVVGLSIALETQLPFVEETVREMRSAEQTARILVGGLATLSLGTDDLGDGVEVWRRSMPLAASTFRQMGVAV